jgi:hypothetical protein
MRLDFFFQFDDTLFKTLDLLDRLGVWGSMSDSLSDNADIRLAPGSVPTIHTITTQTPQPHSSQSGEFVTPSTSREGENLMTPLPSKRQSRAKRKALKEVHFFVVAYDHYDITVIFY